MKLLTVVIAPLFLLTAIHLCVNSKSQPHPSTPTHSIGADNSVFFAANEFAATLSDAQKAKLNSEMTKSTVTRWSNLPVSFGSRNGIQFKDLTATQTLAALKLVRVALGEQGFARFEEIRVADDKLATDDKGFGGGPPGGGRGGPGGPPNGNSGQRGQFGGMGYGAGTYSIAFLNKPSLTEPWMLQIGGHHLAFNLFYNGKTKATTPYFIGVEPTKWKDATGKEHEPLKPMRDAMYGLVNSLSAEQKSQAKIDQTFGDIYLGPRANGRFPANSVGIPGAQLSSASRALLRQAITAWVSDNASSADFLNLYFSELDATKISYSGTTTLQQHGDYVRIDGPHVWIELICQDGIVYRNQIHYHTVWRDRKSDYGVDYAF